MILLAIDTAASLCAACVYDTDAAAERGRAVLDLGKGHAERLMGVIGEALAAAGIAYPDLGAIAVSVGPGSFTGIRVGVSTARGLALALKIPSVGITTLEAIAAQARAAQPERPVLAVLDGGRGELHAALYDPQGRTLAEPAVLTLDAAAAWARAHAALLAGSAAPLVAAATGLPVAGTAATADIAVYARLGAEKVAAGAGKPSPLYLRAADAKPQASFVLPREGRP